jgi:hypothetical protein
VTTPGDEDATDDGPTGHPAVDAAMEALGEVASLAPGEQVSAYVEAHRALQETLGTIEER